MDGEQHVILRETFYPNVLEDRPIHYLDNRSLIYFIVLYYTFHLSRYISARNVTGVFSAAFMEMPQIH